MGIIWIEPPHTHSIAAAGTGTAVTGAGSTLSHVPVSSTAINSSVTVPFGATNSSWVAASSGGATTTNVGAFASPTPGSTNIGGSSGAWSDGSAVSTLNTGTFVTSIPSDTGNPK